MATTNGCGYISSLRDFFFPFFILYNFFSRQYKAGKKKKSGLYVAVFNECKK
jgi:hypothetical protein